MAAILKFMTSNRKSNSINQCVFYMKNIPAKFHPDPILNDGALGFLDQVEEWWPQQQEEQE